MKRRILFICKYNRFRSKIAEALFNKLNKNNNFKTKSAGVIKGSLIDEVQRKVGKRLGVRIKGNPHGISTKLLRLSNIIIIVADDVPLSLFKGSRKYGKKLMVWKIPDSKSDDEKEIEKIIILIIARDQNNSPFYFVLSNIATDDIEELPKSVAIRRKLNQL